MRFTVTALGSAGDKPVGVVIGTIARYLVAREPQAETSGGPSPVAGEGQGSVARYYADRGDTPGRWLGQGASELGLAGEVDFDGFTSVLAGRDPRTGARLITARGSAGRVSSLGTGTVARWGPNGEALYGVRDAARILGWSQADVRAAIAEGERLAASRLLEALTGTAIPAGTRAAGRTGNGTGGDPGRDRDARTRAPGPGRASATRQSTGTATKAPQRMPAHSTETTGMAVPAGTRAAATTRNRTAGDPGRDRDARTRAPGPGRARAGDRDRAGNEPGQRPGPGRETGTDTGNAQAQLGRAATAAGLTPTGRAGSGQVTADAGRDDPGMALVPFVNRDRTRYVSDAELSRVDDVVSRRVSADAVRAAGDPGDELSIPNAARLVGASPSYLARLCRTYLEHRDEITAALAGDGSPKRGYLVCRRNADGRYLVTRAELAAFAERRRRPAVRVGYDVTATTEKSISVLALLGGPPVRREALAAFEAANDAGLRWLEYNAAAARAGGQVVGVTGWTAASGSAARPLVSRPTTRRSPTRSSAASSLAATRRHQHECRPRPLRPRRRRAGRHPRAHRLGCTATATHTRAGRSRARRAAGGIGHGSEWRVCGPDSPAASPNGGERPCQQQASRVEHHPADDRADQREHPARLQTVARTPGPGPTAVRLGDRDGGPRPPRGHNLPAERTRPTCRRAGRHRVQHRAPYLRPRSARRRRREQEHHPLGAAHRRSSRPPARSDHSFAIRYSSHGDRSVEIYGSARKHGIDDADMVHAVDYAMAVGEQEDGKVLYLGPDRAGNLLEVVTVARDHGSEIVIHAMRMRRSYEPFLRGTGGADG